MTIANKATVNFSGGEVDPNLVARFDIPLYNKILGRMQNFIAEPAGPARYRPGTKYVHHTRNNNPAVFIEFQFNDQQSYLIEATAGYFRFYKDEGIILNSTPLTITDISQASPGVVTYTGTDPEDGQEVYIDDVEGMTEVNGRFFTIANVDTGANTFELTDVFGNNIDTSGYTAYSSGGEASVVYEIKTPYRESDLDWIKFAQNADTMYVVNRAIEPRKLTRNDHDDWTLERYTRTADPFAGSSTFGAVTAITQANPGVLTSASHPFDVDDPVYVSGVAGMTELNDRHFLINSTPTANTFTLKDPDTGDPIDTSGFTAYTSGGIVEKVDIRRYPTAVAFTDGARLCMAAKTSKPETLWFSRSPTSAGAVRFDDFTDGTGASNSMEWTLAPLQGKVDSIRWLVNTDKYLAVGTYGSIRRMYGASEGEPVAVDAVTARSANSDGVHPAMHVVDGSTVFYIGRSGLTVESIEYDYTIDGYKPDDKNLVSSHLTVGGLKQLKRQVGKPNLIWSLRNDGLLLGFTFNGKENIAGWHRHTIGGSGIVENIGIMPRESNQDQLWLVVKRTIDGNTVRYVEFMTDPPQFPAKLDFYTGNNDGSNDQERFENYQFEVLKNAIHLDSCLTYDGSAYGTAAGASITMGEDADIEDAEDITVTASAAVFTSDMVGREIWGKYTSEGIGGGRFEITEFVSSTEVKGTILDTFPSIATYEAGDWFITATTVSGLDHLEGESVGIVTDGAVPEEQFVENGSISTAQAASVIHVGLRYRGIGESLALDHGGASGPAQNKLRSVTKVAFRFVNSAGVQFGTDIDSLEQIEFRRGNDFTGRPAPLFNGVDEAYYEDSHELDKRVVFVQDLPLPCTIASMDVFMDVSEP